MAKQYENSGVVTIAGGSHADALPEEALHNGIKIVVHGEGEKTMKELFDRLVINGEAYEGTGHQKVINLLTDKYKSGMKTT